MNNSNTTKEIRLASLQVQMTTLSAKRGALKMALEQLDTKLGDEFPQYLRTSYKTAIAETLSEYQKLNDEYKTVEQL